MIAAAELEVHFGGLRVFRHEAWTGRFPRLVQGITGRAAELDFGAGPRTERPADAASSPAPAGGWERLRQAMGIGRIARCRQVHGSDVALCPDPGPPGVRVLGEADALVTGAPDVLLAVTVADCVPVFIVDTERRIVGLAHAGWRGTAAGVVEATLEAMRRLGSEPRSWRLYLGPAICKGCYEVGPEVSGALGLSPAEGRFVDLRDRIAGRAVAAGVDPGRLTVSRACTRCQSDRFFSYRGGDRGQRMCAFLGWWAG
jgi:YfiH family protein